MCLTENCITDNYKYNYCKHCYFEKRQYHIQYNSCFLCGCQLRPFKIRKDWNNRFMHKKCWKEYTPYFS